MDKKYDKPFSIYHAPIYHGKVCKRLFRFSSYPFLLLAAAWAGDHGLAVLDVDQHPFFYWAVCGYLFFHWLGEASAELTARRRSLLPGWLQRQPVPTLLAAAWIGLLWWVEQLPLDTAVFEVHLNVPGVAAVLLTLVVVLALICPPQHWKSYRFHRLIEGLGLSVLCLFTPLPWLALVPACYFSALFLYGHPGQAEPDLDHVFSVRDDAQVMAEPRYMGALLVFYAVQTPIMIF